MDNKEPRLDMAKFEALVAARFRVAAVLSVLMLAIYYGFILILAFDKGLFMAKIGEHATLWLPVGLGVIVAAWALTGVYVGWANGTYDRMVKDIKDSMRW